LSWHEVRDRCLGARLADRLRVLPIAFLFLFIILILLVSSAADRAG
jgi:hypothetical protein